VRFADPQLLWLLLLAPLAAVLAAWAWRRRIRATAAWASEGLWDRLLPGYRPRRLAVSVALLTLAVAGVAAALAGPRWGRAEEEVERRGVDVVFFLDSSLSMGAMDLQPSRLAVAKVLVRRMIHDLPGNRLALVQAEGVGEVLAPLTTDAAALDMLLSEAQPGSLREPGTELAEALQAALDLFAEEDTKHRVLVVLSDGEDHGGSLEAQIARLQEAGVVVHAVGVATPEGAPVPVPGMRQDTRGAFKTDRDGQVVISQLGEQVLETLARRTGGVYLRATGPATSLDPLLERVRGMDAELLSRDTVELLQERFQWPLALAALALVLYLAWPPFGTARRRLPA
jgi:Ca-activated chloride channel homolog